jgi:hypothetical protein
MKRISASASGRLSRRASRGEELLEQPEQAANLKEPQRAGRPKGDQDGFRKLIKGILAVIATNDASVDCGDHGGIIRQLFLHR